MIKVSGNAPHRGWSVAAVCFLFSLVALAYSGEFLAQVFAQRPAAPGSMSGGESLSSHCVELPDGRQLITLIDQRTRCMAVYQVDPRTGAIGLKSVRNVQWDLQMDEFNTGGNPSPKEIRTLLEQR
jgi:hypothetical protein